MDCIVSRVMKSQTRLSLSLFPCKQMPAHTFHIHSFETFLSQVPPSWFYMTTSKSSPCPCLTGEEPEEYRG